MWSKLHNPRVTSILLCVPVLVQLSQVLDVLSLSAPVASAGLLVSRAISSWEIFTRYFSASFFPGFSLLFSG